MTHLRYLDFDYSEDTEGHGTFDAMATTVPAKTREVLAEVAEVLAWANATFPDAQGALEDGAAWDFDLQQTSEAPELDTVTFSLSGTPDFCAALREQFKLD
jgi:wyosine [tRNA(Phe)-imidazoG37] synthetase (radical SAM superfamily)